MLKTFNYEPEQKSGFNVNSKNKLFKKNERLL